MQGFKDHFSGNSASYAKARPTYPDALYDWLAQIAPRRQLAWDCGCGAGQASLGLAERFARVIATDASADQIAAAAPHPKVTYRTAPAEASGIEAARVDLTVVAQALHWFDFDRFYAELRRVSRPDGVLAAITYAMFRVSPEVDALIDAFYSDVTGPYWPAERRHVETDYRDIPFPFERIVAPDFSIERSWLPEQVTAMVDTWSGLKAYRKATGNDPLPELHRSLLTVWGDPLAARPVRWAVKVIAGRNLGGAG